MSERGWLLHVPLRKTRPETHDGRRMLAPTAAMGQDLKNLGVDDVAVLTSSDGLEIHVAVSLSPETFTRAATPDDFSELLPAVLSVITRHGLLPADAEFETDPVCIWHDASV